MERQNPLTMILAFALSFCLLLALPQPTWGGKSKEPKGKKKTLPKKLYQKQIPSLSFKETRFSHVLEFFHDISGFNFYLSPDINPKKHRVTLSLKNLSLKNVLDLLAMQHSLVYEWKFNTIIFRKKSKTPWTSHKLPSNLPKFLKKQKVSLNLRKTSFTDTVSFLRGVTGKNFVIHSGVKAKKIAPVTYKADKIKVKNALAIILFSRGLTFEWKNGTIFISKMKKKSKDEK